jgi:hypothetical protein|tara:strand:- start:1299 stop:2072 length:774 start_codon:yes stop_codon:yes gene_type:complete
MSSYREYDSFTADDGTKYVARFKKGRNIIQKVDSDGRTTTLSSSKGGTTSSNKARVSTVFDLFKTSLETAKSGTKLTYSDDDVTPGGGGGLFGGGDKYSTLKLSDGTFLKSAAGKTKDEVRTVRRLADEVSNYSSSINNDDDDDDDTSGTTTLDNDTNTALTNVENISTSTFDNTDNISNYFDNTATSAVNTAAGIGTNMASALTTSVGAAEDEAISYMDSGTASNVVNTGGAQGLLGGDDEDDDDPFNRRKTLIGA